MTQTLVEILIVLASILVIVLILVFIEVFVVLRDIESTTRNVKNLTKVLDTSMLKSLRGIISILRNK